MPGRGEAGVVGMICVGTNLETSRGAIADAARFPDVRATVGLHPHDASELDAVWDELETLAASDDVVGIGETGFDLHYNHSPSVEQEVAFRAHIRLAHRLGRALVIHSRNAWDDTFRVLADDGVPERTVFHCFTGGPDEAQRAVALGAYLSFSGIVSFKNADDVRAAAASTPLDRMLVETDAPFLAPVPAPRTRERARARGRRRGRAGRRDRPTTLRGCRRDARERATPCSGTRPDLRRRATCCDDRAPLRYRHPFVLAQGCGHGTIAELARDDRRRIRSLSTNDLRVARRATRTEFARTARCPRTFDARSGRRPRARNRTTRRRGCRCRSTCTSSRRVEDLLDPDPDVQATVITEAEAVVHNAFVAVQAAVAPSPARAEPHDAAAWLPLPDVHALPEATREPPPAPPLHHRVKHRLPPIRAFLIALVASALVVGVAWGGKQLTAPPGSKVTLVVDGTKVAVRSEASTVGQFLAQRHVRLASADTVTPAPSDGVAGRAPHPGGARLPRHRRLRRRHEHRPHDPARGRCARQAGRRQTSSSPSATSPARCTRARRSCCAPGTYGTLLIDGKKINVRLRVADGRRAARDLQRDARR